MAPLPYPFYSHFNNAVGLSRGRAVNSATGTRMFVYDAKIKTISGPWVSAEVRVFSGGGSTIPLPDGTVANATGAFITRFIEGCLTLLIEAAELCPFPGSPLDANYYASVPTPVGVVVVVMGVSVRSVIQSKDGHEVRLNTCAYVRDEQSNFVVTYVLFPFYPYNCSCLSPYLSIVFPPRRYKTIPRLPANSPVTVVGRIHAANADTLAIAAFDISIAYPVGTAALTPAGSAPSLASSERGRFFDDSVSSPSE
jgi:hypothetical protein